MIKTLTIALIISGLIIFFLILALIGQLDDLCEMEKEIEILQNDLDRANSKLKESIAIRLKAIEYIENNITDDYEYHGLLYKNEEKEKLLEILEGEEDDR